jgi:hypothetical protein
MVTLTVGVGCGGAVNDAIGVGSSFEVGSEVGCVPHATSIAHRSSTLPHARRALVLLSLLLLWNLALQHFITDHRFPKR